jgi:hypothetical protein
VIFAPLAIVGFSGKTTVKPAELLAQLCRKLFFDTKYIDCLKCGFKKFGNKLLRMGSCIFFLRTLLWRPLKRGNPGAVGIEFQPVEPKLTA